MSSAITGLPPDPILERRQLIQLRASQTLARRTLTSRLAVAALSLSLLVAMIPLFSVVIALVAKGAHYLTWHFVTTLPQLPSLISLNTIGGIGNAIVATLEIDLAAAVVAVPVGVVVGLYLAETDGRVGAWLRGTVEMMTGMPSVLLGVFAYEYIVTSMKSYSGLAAAELSFRSVPRSLREAALALGARESKVAWKVTVPTALPGVVTGVLLALARAVGETAPVLLVVGPTVSNLWAWTPFKPMTPLPLLIYGYSQSQYPSQRAAAWGVAFTLVALVVLLTVTSRVISSRMRRERRH